MRVYLQLYSIQNIYQNEWILQVEKQPEEKVAGSKCMEQNRAGRVTQIPHAAPRED